MNTVESKTADTILQNSSVIRIGDNEYMTQKPTAATLIEVSKYISTLPELHVEDEKRVIYEVLAHASECEYIGDILAILILGKKNLEPIEVITKKYKFGFIPIKVKSVYHPREELAKQILLELSPEEIFEYTFSALESMKVAFFLNTIIFLRDVNLLKTTKV